eukprot:jgi/Tetstr1/448137/TSEL_035430.t1
MSDGEEPVAEPTLKSLRCKQMQDDRRLPAQEEYLWMSCFGAHMATLFVALDELLPYVPATNHDFTPYLARARNHAEAIDKAFRFRLAFLRRLNEIKRVHGDQARKRPLLLEWRLQLQVAGVGEDVAVDAGVAAKDAFGSDELGQRTLDLLSSSLSAQTLKSYAGRLSQFAEFCHDSENISPLEATTATVVRYVAWIGERGHIAAKSLQPYLSAINTFFELHNLDPIAKDSLHLTSARRGLMLRQRRLDAAPFRVLLPADVAYRFVTKAELIVSAPYPEYHHDFRALLASVVNFMFFGRGLTGVSGRVRDVHVDDYNITLQVCRPAAGDSKMIPSTKAVEPHGGQQLPSLHNAKIAAMIRLELAATSAADHWIRGQEARFVAQEADLRELNQKAALLTSANEVTNLDSVTHDAFVSHSVRGADTQELKRRLICALSRVREGGKKAGLVYWADFLDLAERGPLPWRREIEEGIRSSSKVLAFIDHAFLTSFNCIMELAAAFEMQKPVVPIILDEKGREFLGGALFSKATLCAVFQRVSNINFCSCRSTDVDHWGIEYVSERFFADVTKDLPYLKEWAQLNEQALKWHLSGQSLASLPRKAALEKWVAWSAQAIKYQMEPPPTSLQREYIKESSRFFVRQKRALSVLAVAILLLILAGAVGSAVMGIRAQQAAAEARENAAVAEEKTHLAEEKSNLAVANQLLAERNANLAERNANLTTVLLLSANPTPLTGREKRTLLKAMEVASKVDRLDMVMSQLQTAVRTLAYEPFWQYELEGHFEALTVKFSPDGGHLVSGGVNDKLRVWALKFSEGSFMPVPQAPAILGCVENGESLSVDWSVRGVIAGGTSSFNTVCLWKNDGKSWVLADKIEGQGSANVWAVGFSPTGELLASGDDTGALFVWDVTSSPASLHATFRFNTTDSPGDVRALAWTPDGTFIVAGGVNQVVSVVDLTTGATVASYPTHGDISDIRITVDKGEGSAWSRVRIMVASDRRDGVAYAYLFSLEAPEAGGQWPPLSALE